MRDQRIQVRSNQLIQEKTTITDIEELNAAVMRIMLDTEDEMPPLPNLWWSEELHVKHLICRYWATVVSMNHNQLADKKLLTSIRVRIPDNHDVFQGDEEKSAIYEFLQAKKERKNC
eukprot:4317526-Ditylum_brightwellii.AAC.1